jgi:hypothetical protein
VFELGVDPGRGVLEEDAAPVEGRRLRPLGHPGGWCVLDVGELELDAGELAAQRGQMGLLLVVDSGVERAGLVRPVGPVDADVGLDLGVCGDQGSREETERLVERDRRCAYPKGRCAETPFRTFG